MGMLCRRLGGLREIRHLSVSPLATFQGTHVMQLSINAFERPSLAPRRLCIFPSLALLAGCRAGCRRRGRGAAVSSQMKMLPEGK